MTGAAEASAPSGLPPGGVCFRFAPEGLDGIMCDRLNREIVEAINASGLAYLTHTEVGGRIVMRVGIGNILTTQEQIAGVWAAIVAAAATRG